MEQVLVLDLETLPDLDAGRALLGDAALGMDAVALRRALGSRYAREGQDPATAFLKPVLHRVCVIGVLRAEREGPDMPWRVTRIRARSTDALSEAEMLAGLEASFRQQPVLVGFNTMGFDLPVLRYRALALGVAMPALLGPGGKDYAYRFGTAHIDMCERLSGFRATTPPSLAEACSLLGIPAKGEMSGFDVEPAMAAGRGAEVARYCETDVAATFLLWLRWMQAMGAAEIPASFAAFADFAEGTAHLAGHAAAARRLAGL